MDKSPNGAEGVFAEAIELPPGAARDRLLAERCGEDTALRREVASLLHAHDRAGDFMNPPPSQPTVRADSTTTTSQSTVGMNAAAHADAFLRGFEGTPLYASPEQAKGEALSPASDVFSLGSLMFKVLTGKAPFAGASISQVLEAIVSTAPPFLRGQLAQLFVNEREQFMGGVRVALLQPLKDDGEFGHGTTHSCFRDRGRHLFYRLITHPNGRPLWARPEFQAIDLAKEYGRGNVHTNGLENFSCSSVALSARTSVLNRFICFVILMRKRSDLTTEKAMTVCGSRKRWTESRGGD